METDVYANYKPTRYEGKGFLHRDITGEMGFGVGVFSDLFINQVKQFIRQFSIKLFHKCKAINYLSVLGLIYNHDYHIRIFLETSTFQTAFGIRCQKDT